MNNKIWYLWFRSKLTFYFKKLVGVHLFMRNTVTTFTYLKQKRTLFFVCLLCKQPFVIWFMWMCRFESICYYSLWICMSYQAYKDLFKVLTYLLVLVSAFTLVGLNWLPPEQVLIEEDTLGFDWGKGPKFYPEKCPVCHRFSTDALTEQPKAAGCRNRHLLDFHQSPFSRVVALIPLSARPIRLGWPYQEPKFPTA